MIKRLMALVAVLATGVSLLIAGPHAAQASEDNKGRSCIRVYGRCLAEPSYAPKAKPHTIEDGATTLLGGYAYAQGQTTLASAATSAAGNYTIWKPTLGADTHSLAELAVADSTQSNIVEVGWTVDAGVCGSIANSPCLFVYHWVNGAATCYNGCGWVDNGAVALNAGSTLTASGGTAATLKTLKLGIRYVASSSICGAGSPAGWLVTAWYSTGTTQDVGCFPASLWTSPTFTTYTRLLGFGEVNYTGATPVAQMGSGVCGSVGNINTTGFIGSLQSNLGLATMTWSATNSAWYEINNISGSSAYYGGDASCP